MFDLIRQLLKHVRNLGLYTAVQTLSDVGYNERKATDLYFEMHNLGLIDREKHPMIDHCRPPSHIGMAIDLANEYGVTLHHGTCYGECRASLSKDKWLNPINRNVPLVSLAYFLIPKSYEEIDAFHGHDGSVAFAICKCLIQARIAGVI